MVLVKKKDVGSVILEARGRVSSEMVCRVYEVPGFQNTSVKESPCWAPDPLTGLESENCTYSSQSDSFLWASQQVKNLGLPRLFDRA
jgi:hypothetical protein